MEVLAATIPHPTLHSIPAISMNDHNERENDDGSSPPRPPRRWIRPPLGLLASETTMADLFEQIRRGLDRQNAAENEQRRQRQRQRGGGANRFSDRFAPVRAAAAANNSNNNSGSSSSAARPAAAASAAAASSSSGSAAASSSSSSQAHQGMADAHHRPLFASQLSRHPNQNPPPPAAPPRQEQPVPPREGHASIFQLYDPPPRNPKLRSVAPFKFDPPRFRWGDDATSANGAASNARSGASAAAQAFGRRVTPPVQQEYQDREQANLKSASEGDAATKADDSKRSCEGLRKSDVLASSMEPGSSAADDTKKPSATKSGSTSSYSPSSSQGIHGSTTSSNTATTLTGKRKHHHQSIYDFDAPYSSFPVPSRFGPDWTQEEVEGLVAFANKWIPNLKKRRTGDEK